MGPDSTDDSNPVVWICPDCGREHQKHSPPCSRCGSATLEKREADYSDLDDVGGTGWLDVLDRKYTAGFAVVGVFGLVLVLGMAGVVDLPGLGGTPSPPEVAGENETYRGVSLSETEAAFVATINQERENAGDLPVERGATLTQMATYYNRRHVEHDRANADAPTLSELDPFDPECDMERDGYLLTDQIDDPGRLVNQSAERTGWSAGSLGRGLVYDYAGGPNNRITDRLRADGASRIGVDIFVTPDDELYLTILYC